MKKNRYFKIVAFVTAALFALGAFSSCNKITQPPVPSAYTVTPIPSAAIATPQATPPSVTQPPTPQPTDDGQMMISCKSFLNLRAKSNEDSEVVGKVTNGELVTVLGYENKFAKISFDGMTGYVLSGYLEDAGEESYTADLMTVIPTDEYTYDQMMSDISSLVAKHPDSLSSSIIGKSECGRDIPVLVLGNDATAKERILITGSFHAREHMTTLLAMALVDFMLSYPDAQYGGAGIASRLSEVCFHIVPMINPDGVAISQGEPPSQDILKIYSSDKKYGYTDQSEGEYFREWKANAKGVDLNRNFDGGWNAEDTREAPSSMNYKGSSVECAAESKALGNYTRQNSFDVTISLHAFGSIIYWQYSDDAEILKTCHNLSEAVSELTGFTTLEKTAEEEGSGGFKDWVIQELKIPSLTIEIGSKKCPLPLLEFSTVWLRCKYLLPVLADWALAN